MPSWQIGQICIISCHIRQFCLIGNSAKMKLLLNISKFPIKNFLSFWNALNLKYELFELSLKYSVGHISTYHNLANLPNLAN